MFKYDNRGKIQFAKNIIEFLRQSRGVVISMQAAERIAYLLNMRKIIVDSIDVEGKDSETGQTVETKINIKEINQNLQNKIVFP